MLLKNVQWQGYVKSRHVFGRIKVKKILIREPWSFLRGARGRGRSAARYSDSWAPFVGVILSYQELAGFGKASNQK